MFVEWKKTDTNSWQTVALSGLDNRIHNKKSEKEKRIWMAALGKMAASQSKANWAARSQANRNIHKSTYNIHMYGFIHVAKHYSGQQESREQGSWTQRGAQLCWQPARQPKPGLRLAGPESSCFRGSTSLHPDIMVLSGQRQGFQKFIQPKNTTHPRLLKLDTRNSSDSPFLFAELVA